MLYLDNNKSNILKARRRFVRNLTNLLYTRIDALNGTVLSNIVASRFFDNFINSHLELILGGRPAQLETLNSALNPIIQQSAQIRAGVEYVFNYDWFIEKRKKRYNAYFLAEDLGINTCIYCNRNYTSTVILENGDKITRPQFDHFVDKGRNPLLAISFYNLIPSCSVCNSGIKGTAPFTIASHLHPYLDNEVSQIQFSYEFSSETKSGLKILVDAPKSIRAQTTLTAFAIQDVYNSHSDELSSLLRTKQYFSETYLDVLTSNLLKDVIVSKTELYRTVFGVEYDEQNFHNRPFSKFKKDILTELGII